MKNFLIISFPMCHWDFVALSFLGCGPYKRWAIGIESECEPKQ